MKTIFLTLLSTMALAILITPVNNAIAELTSTGMAVLNAQCGNNADCIEQQTASIEARCAHALKAIASDPTTARYYQGVISMCSGEPQKSAATLQTPRRSQQQDNALRQESLTSPYTNIIPTTPAKKKRGDDPYSPLDQ